MEALTEDPALTRGGGVRRNSVAVLGAAVAGLLTLAAVISGCGGVAKQYAVGPTEQCLFKQAAVLHYAEADADFVGLAAPGGGIEITLAQNAVTLGFERNSGDASDDLRSASALGASSGPKLHADANVYVSWDNTPTDAEKAAVEGCLSSGTASRIKNKYPAAVVAPFTSHCVSAAAGTGASAGAAASYCGCVIEGIEASWTVDQAQQQLAAASPAITAIEANCRSAVSSGSGGTSTVAAADATTADATTSAAASASGATRIHIPPTSAEGAAILAALRSSPDAGPKTRLLGVTATLLDPDWVAAGVDSGPNTQGALAILHRVGGRWTLATLGTSFGCSDPAMPPPAVSKDLNVGCFNN